MKPLMIAAFMFMACARFVMAAPPQPVVDREDALYNKCYQELEAKIKEWQTDSAPVEEKQRRAEVLQAQCMHPNASARITQLVGLLNADLAELAKKFILREISSAQYAWDVRLATSQFVRLKASSADEYRPIASMTPQPAIPQSMLRAMDGYDSMRDQLIPKLALAFDTGCLGAPGPYMIRALNWGRAPQGTQAGFLIFVEKAVERTPDCKLTYAVDLVFQNPITPGLPEIRHHLLLFAASENISPAGDPIARLPMERVYPSAPEREAAYFDMLHYYKSTMTVYAIDGLGRASDRSLPFHGCVGDPGQC